MTIVNFRYKGSSSSGNRGHAGRPGKVGGSAPKGNEAVFDQVSLDNSRKLSTAISKTVGKATSSRVAYDSVVESVSKGLSDKTGMKQDEVKDILYGWAFRHLDRNHTVEKLKDAVENSSNAYHELARQMYDDTQSQLRAMGFKPTDKIRLYRGISTTAPENEKQLGYEYAHEGETLGSWTYSKATAKAVAASTYTYKEGRVIEAEVPISQIFSLGTTGVGYTADKEVVLLKSRMPVRVTARYVSGESMWNPWEEQKELNDNPTIRFRYKGSSTSGNRGHAGRPGKVGGSAPKSQNIGTTQESIYLAAPGETLPDSITKGTSKSLIIIAHRNGVLASDTFKYHDELVNMAFQTDLHTKGEWFDNGVHIYRTMSQSNESTTALQASPNFAVPTSKIQQLRRQLHNSPEALAQAINSAAFLNLQSAAKQLQRVGFPADTVLQMSLPDPSGKYLAGHYLDGTIADWQSGKVTAHKEMIMFYEFKDLVAYKGSARSGNYGHAGRIGKVGGSSPRGSGLVSSKYGFQLAVINGNDNLDGKTLAELQKLYEPTEKQRQELSQATGQPIGSPGIEPGMRFAYDSTTNKWVISPDAYAHDALRVEAGPWSRDEPYEFRQVTGFYDAKANKLYFYDFRDNVEGVEYMAESMNMDVRAINRKFGAAIYAAKTNLFTANGARPSISYFSELTGTYDKEWHVKFRYKGSASSGNRGHTNKHSENLNRY